MEEDFKRVMALIKSHQKSSHPWHRQQRVDQSYSSWSPDRNQWSAATPGRGTPSSADCAHLSVMSWNIDMMLRNPDQRMLAALKHLQSHVQDNPNPTVILLQEMVQSDLRLIQADPWVRTHYNVTDVDATFWESGYYGTCTLVPKALPITAVYRIHYEHTAMERDALFVDLDLGRGQSIRICNTHLESLVADPPRRPPQLQTAAREMHDAAVSGSILGGDLNAIQDFDRMLHADNGLQDAYLGLGGAEDRDDGYTWGQMAPVALRQRFGCSRMDKLLFCGNLQCDKFETFGLGVEAEGPEVVEQIMKSGLERGYVTDHLGVRADFRVLGDARGKGNTKI